MAQNSDKRQGPDLNSIRTTTMFSFVIFALFLLAILWGLSNFFLNAYYERARTQEVIQLAEGLTAEYQESREEFDDYAIDIAESNDIYIRLDASHEQLEYDGTRSVRDSELFTP